MPANRRAAADLDEPGIDQQPDDDPKEEIARLRVQVEQLMRDRVTPAVADAAGRAEEAAYQARDYAQAKVESVVRSVRDRPLTALAIAAGVGYFIGRVSR
jgi:ElaB/YqjD/DUF883 family membrane-anchored ribosome-binding protein